MRPEVRTITFLTPVSVCVCGWYWMFWEMTAHQSAIIISIEWENNDFTVSIERNPTSLYLQGNCAAFALSCPLMHQTQMWCCHDGPHFYIYRAQTDITHAKPQNTFIFALVTLVWAWLSPVMKYTTWQHQSFKLPSAVYPSFAKCNDDWANCPLMKELQPLYICIIMNSGSVVTAINRYLNMNAGNSWRTLSSLLMQSEHFLLLRLHITSV